METKQETFQVPCGYNKGKTPVMVLVRKCTLEDIKAMMNNNKSDYPMLDRQGKLRLVSVNGRLKTWKRNPNRFERSFRYGLYEHFRLDTQGMLDQILIEVVG